MASAEDHADNEQFWRIAIFFLLSGRGPGQEGWRPHSSSCVSSRDCGGGRGLAVAGANSLVVTRLH